MATMRAVQVSRPNGPFEIVERPVPEPGAGTVRIRVLACGICHSDSLTKEGTFPGLQYPRVPGHEVAGVIDAVGPGVAGWKPGERVGVGWNGGYCGHCDPCRRGNFFACVTGQVTGISYDGGYAEYLVAPASAVARMPAELPPADAAPLLCAGLTTFNALRNSGARPGDVVAILGLGGLDASVPLAPALRLPLGQGLVFRDFNRLRGHARLQRPDRRAFDERELPAGAGRRSLRPHDERQGTLPRRLDRRGITADDRAI